MCFSKETHTVDMEGVCVYVCAGGKRNYDNVILRAWYVPSVYVVDANYCLVSDFQNSKLVRPAGKSNFEASFQTCLANSAIKLVVTLN